MGDKLSMNQNICFTFIYLNEHLLHCLLPSVNFCDPSKIFYWVEYTSLKVVECF